jgi:hypothetical protein
MNTEIKVTKPVVTLMQLEGMDPVAARKMIAQDAIDGINARYYIAVPGMYFSRIEEEKIEKILDLGKGPGKWPRADALPGGVLFNSNSADEDAREALVKAPKAACGVCALGTMLLSSIYRFNSCTVKDIGFVTGSTFGFEPRRYLQKFFSREDLAWAEACFEGKVYYLDKETFYNRESALRVVHFYAMYRYDPDARLLAIFQAMLESEDGHFVPPAPSKEFLEEVQKGNFDDFDIPEEGNNRFDDDEEDEEEEFEDDEDEEDEEEEFEDDEDEEDDPGEYELDDEEDFDDEEE